MEQLEKTHAQFVFIYQRLSALQYFPDEFEIAKDSLQTVVEMVQKLKSDIEELKKANENEEKSE